MNLTQEFIECSVMLFIHTNRSVDEEHFSSFSGFFDIYQSPAFARNSGTLVLTEIGQGRLRRLLTLMDLIRTFEIFSEVFPVEIPEELLQSGVYKLLVKDEVDDPRFSWDSAYKLDPTCFPEDHFLIPFSYFLDKAEDGTRSYPDYSSVRILFLRRLHTAFRDGFASCAADLFGLLFSGAMVRQLEDTSDHSLRWVDLVSEAEAEDLDLDQRTAKRLAWERAGCLIEAGTLQFRKDANLPLRPQDGRESLMQELYSMALHFFHPI